MYNDSTGPTNYLIVPYYLIDRVPSLPAWLLNLPLVLENVLVTYNISYTEKSSTELWRGVEVMAGDLHLRTNWVSLWSWGYSGGSSYFQSIVVSPQASSVEKNKFYTSSHFQWIDYFDSTIGPGGQILEDAYVISISADQIVAQSIDLASGANKTYVADANGKVLSCMITETHLGMINCNYTHASYLFISEINPSSEIPSFSLLGIFLGVFITIILFRLWYYRQKIPKF